MKVTNQNLPAPFDATMLDRLVDGELEDAERAALLSQLDREPDGWKRCALAFLESQAWRQALAADSLASGEPKLQTHATRRTPSRRWMGLAASVLIAFSVGFAARRPGTSDGASVPGGRIVAQRAETVPAAAPRRAAATVSAVPEHLRLQMERQGYQVDGERKLVPVALDDGRKVAVPIDTVSMRYVGQRIH